MNKKTVELIDELKYKLKTRDKDDELAQSLNHYLDNIINMYVLDQDPHSFATIPKNLPPKIGPFPKHMKDIKKWVNLIYEWVPEQPIQLSNFLARCMHNSTAPGEIVSSIRAAVLSLKEDGRIELSNDNVITKKQVVEN